MKEYNVKNRKKTKKNVRKNERKSKINREKHIWYHDMNQIEWFPFSPYYD